MASGSHRRVNRAAVLSAEGGLCQCLALFGCGFSQCDALTILLHRGAVVVLSLPFAAARSVIVCPHCTICHRTVCNNRVRD